MNPAAGFSGHLVTPSFVARHCSLAQPGVESAWRATAAVCRHARDELGPASSVRQIFDLAVVPLASAIGLNPVDDVRVGDQHVAARIRTGGGAATIVAVPWASSLERFWRTAIVEAHRDRAAWCLLSNGLQLRIVDGSRLYGRRYLECDLPLVVDRVETFAGLFRLVAGQALFASASDGRSLHAIAADSDRDAAAICRSLRDGVRSASTDVLGALLRSRPGRASDSIVNVFEQSLTIVYRIVFLLFAEARALVPIWHPVYRDSYSVDALRRASERSTAARGLWDSLRAMARLAHAGCNAGDLRVTPFNGRLFAPARTPLAERRGLDDDAARRAVLALATRPTADRTGRERIVYRELGVEQLGAVYETLLDYQPRVSVETPAGGRKRTAVSVTLESGSGVRKATGTFYTPQPLADCLVRRTLMPLVRDATPENILALRIVDPAMGSGAFLVSACRFLSTAYERALVETGAASETDFDEPARTSIRRLVAERCLYGVDLNPMAVQLARLSLWLTTLAADRPLSFLDHRLASGDSLLGAWLHQLRHPPRARRGNGTSQGLPLFGDGMIENTMIGALPVRFSIEHTANDTIDQVRMKERAFTALSAGSALARWKAVADVWCASWFAPSSGDLPPDVFHPLADRILANTTGLSAQMSRTYLDRAATIAQVRRFFHWELEFPEVFFDADGRRKTNPGFDAVIGNPPWDMMRAEGDLRLAAPARAIERASVAAAVRFTRDSGAYRLSGTGHANRYQLFVERAKTLTRGGGRIGLVLPSGLAVDHGSAALRRELLAGCELDAIVGVDNVRAIFPIHRSTRFLLLTATTGRATQRFRCRFGVETAAELDAIADADAAAEARELPIVFTPGLLDRVSGRSLAIPHVHSTMDLQIAEKAAALFPPLADQSGWSALFGRELNSTDDRAAFRPAGEGWPIVDGRHVLPFGVVAERTTKSITPADARRLLGNRVGRPRLAYRDVASATNRLTLISAILPARVVSTHTVFCLRTPMPLTEQHTLCGLFNSLVVNYLVRQRVTTHVTTAIVERLPIPPRNHAPGACRSLAALSRLLSRHPDRAGAYATLNAVVARLYQLTIEEFEHVLGTFPLIPREERDRAMQAFTKGE